MATQIELIENINNTIIEGLQAKGLQWFKPFKDSTTMQWSAINSQGKPYRGINQFILSGKAISKGWVNKWYTFAQVSKLDGRVNKGEKSTDVYLWKVNFAVEIAGKIQYFDKLEKVPEHLQKQAKKVFYLQVFKVFSISQTDLPIDTPSEPIEVSELEADEHAEAILQTWGKEVTLKHSGQGRAYYSPSGDFIHMPSKTTEQWKSNGDYYKVFFHEAIHSTGHKSRLDRLDKMASFGSDEYSKEELVAELGALYLEAITGIQTAIDDFKNSQAYINGWISKFKSDPKLILSASTKAHEAVELILSK
jgi:antirestriction protein ArdC